MKLAVTLFLVIRTKLAQVPRAALATDYPLDHISNVSFSSYSSWSLSLSLPFSLSLPLPLSLSLLLQ